MTAIRIDPGIAQRHLMSMRRVLVAIVTAGTVLASAWLSADSPEQGARPERLFIALLTQVGADVDAIVDEMDRSWQPAYGAMVVESMQLMRHPPDALRLLDLLQKRTGQSIGFDVKAWQRWLWSKPLDTPEFYMRFKRDLYRIVDPNFAAYFNPGERYDIRLDEIMWGGVGQDGIPPLRGPELVAAKDAQYLDDTDLVFGVAINGESRAYPKRILGWHEMVVDTLGGVDIAGVYCTLCGTMIVYETKDAAGTVHELGTSGFLYRSNKLMYDKATSSLWSTMRGEPVVGPLVGKGIRLKRGSTVTTTWGTWRERHPQTKVLSLDTGHLRDYSEGAAYRAYFATDELMFPVPKSDERLRNKAEVLGIWLVDNPLEPVAISIDFLADHPVYHLSIGDRRLVVMSDVSGAARLYEAGDVRFIERTQAGAIDSNGREWKLSESRLEAGDGASLVRVSAHRAFWFGWYAAFNNTRLIWRQTRR